MKSVTASRTFLKKVVTGYSDMCFARYGVARYGMAVGLVGLATLLRLAFAPQEAGIPYVTYFPAATFAALLGGLGPGVLATFLGGFVAVFLFIPPFNELVLHQEGTASLLVFLVEELVTCAVIGAMRHYAAAEIAARQAAERAHDSKSRFFAAVSHDLRQPVQAMRLFLHQLERKAAVSDPAAIDLIVGRMNIALESAETMLGRLMDFAALESGQVAVTRSHFRLDAMLHRLGDEYRLEAERKGLRLMVFAPPTVTDTDPLLLERILRNLLANAVRYTTAGGILIGQRRRGRQVAVGVYDTGCGISATHQDVVFEEFYQIGNPERDRTKGVGLGLATVARSADLLGHRLTLTSRENRGSAFLIEVPRVAEGPAVVAAPATPAASAAAVPAIVRGYAGMTTIPNHTAASPAAVPAIVQAAPASVLVIEDDVLQSTALTFILEDAGVTVTVAGDGATAVAAATTMAPAMILSDYRLPGNQSGLETIHAIRQRLGRDIPAILLTGDIQASTAAADDCVVMHKPYAPDALIGLVRQTLADGRVPSADNV